MLSRRRLWTALPVLGIAFFGSNPAIAQDAFRGLLKVGSPFAAILGIIIGSYLNSAVEMLPGGASVVKTFFTGSIPIGIGDFTQSKPAVLDLSAIKLMLGFQIKFSLLSLTGLIVGLYLFRWYR